MGNAALPERKWQAKALYCAERLDLAAIAERTGVDQARLSAWAKQGRWDAERESLAECEAEIRLNTIRARALALRRLLEAGEDKEMSLALGAVDKLERLALARERFQARREPDSVRKAAPSEENESAPTTALPSAPLSEARRLELLREGVDSRIARLLSGPEAQFSAKVKEIKEALELLEKLGGKESAGVMRVRFDD